MMDHWIAHITKMPRDIPVSKSPEVAKQSGS